MKGLMLPLVLIGYASIIGVIVIAVIETRKMDKDKK